MADADQIFESLRNGQSDVKPNDLYTLYKGFGFSVREGSRHTIYTHPDYPHLRATVARHRRLPIGYARDAVAIIEELLKTQRAANIEKTGETDANKDR